MRLLKKWTSFTKSDISAYVDLLPLPAFTVANGKIKSVNNEGLKLFGAQHVRQLSGLKFLEFFSIDSMQLVQSSLLNPLKLNIQSPECIATLSNLNGESIKVEMRSSNIHFNGNNGFLIIAQNKTRHYHLEQELVEKNHLIEKIAQTIPDIIYVTDIQTNESIFENNSLLKFLGFDNSVVTSNKWTFLFSRVHPEDVPKIRESAQKLQRSTNDTQFVETEYRILDAKDQWKWIYSRSRVFKRDESGKPLQHFGIAHDITALKNTQESLDEKVHELRGKNKELERYITSNRELEKYAYIASHDLKEPLRTIVGFSQLLDKKFHDTIDPEAKEYIDHIIEGTKRMETLVKGLLAYSRVDSNGLPFEPADLNEIMDHIVRDLTNSINENSVQINIQEMPRITCDKLQIRQLFQNLLSNSIKFKSADPLTIDVGWTREDDGILFFIKDNGIGFDMVYHDKVFEIFNRLHSKDKYPGAGIGLSICKRIIERHNGSIWLETKIDHGTTFYFKIPH
ncbi:MAG: PAS domain-containing protein [Chitinophagales bacterium]|nr:PAS domain-containing protein [Chitinophagales bacterium]